jgi:signal transduction histidine kinase
MPDKRLYMLLIMCGYGVLFMVFGHAATVFEVAPGVSIWYATAGLNLALVVLFGAYAVPAILAFTILGGLVISDPPLPLIHMALPSVIVTLAHGVAGLWLRGRWLRLLNDQAHPGLAIEFLKPFFIVCALLPLVIAVPSIGSYYVTGLEGYSVENLAEILLGWWLGDVVGLLTTTPLIVLLVSPLLDTRISFSDLCPDLRRNVFRNVPTHLVMIVIAVAVALFPASPQSNLYFICFLPLLWIALQHGLLRSVVAVFLINVLVAAGIALLRPTAPIEHFQLFMIALAVTGLLVGALVAERRWTIDRMRDAAVRLRMLVHEVEGGHGDASDEPSWMDPSESLAGHLQTLESVHHLLAQSTTQLRILNGEKDRLLAILSHDLRGPLTGIRGLTEMLLDDAKNERPASVGMLSAIQESAIQAHRLMENLLNWARLQTGPTPPRFDRIDLAKIAVDAAALSETTAIRKSVAIEVAIPESFIALGDREMTETIVRNLLSNAVKFTPDDGRIIVGGVRSGNSLNLTVTDTGVGMTSSQLETLFDVGTNISTEGTSGERGTGLGLILCCELADVQGGTITISSELGRGTTATLALPAAEPEPVATPSDGVLDASNTF